MLTGLQRSLLDQCPDHIAASRTGGRWGLGKKMLQNRQRHTAEPLWWAPFFSLQELEVKNVNLTSKIVIRDLKFIPKHTDCVNKRQYPGNLLLGRQEENLEEHHKGNHSPEISWNWYLVCPCGKKKEISNNLKDSQTRAIPQDQAEQLKDCTKWCR